MVWVKSIWWRRECAGLAKTLGGSLGARGERRGIYTATFCRKSLNGKQQTITSKCNQRKCGPKHATKNTNKEEKKQNNMWNNATNTILKEYKLHKSRQATCTTKIQINHTWTRAKTRKTHNHTQSNQTSEKMHTCRTENMQTDNQCKHNQTSTTEQQTNLLNCRFDNDIQQANTRCWPSNT